jgi:hypothetical protein
LVNQRRDHSVLKNTQKKRASHLFFKAYGIHRSAIKNDLSRIKKLEKSKN